MSVQTPNSMTPPAPSAMHLYFHPLYTNGIHPDARFPRERYRLIADRLQRESHQGLLEIKESPAAQPAEVRLAHDEHYVQRFIKGLMTDKERRRIGLRPWTDALIPRTMHIMGGALAATKKVLKEGGFAGNMAGGTHHAHRDWGSGYCVFNDLAICAKMAIEKPEVNRVALLDLDVHQGDGSATILENDSEILTVSLHCEANFPFRKAKSDRDFPLPLGTTDALFLKTLQHALEELEDFAPDLILYQGGVDSLQTDALGKMELSRACLRVRNKMVFDFCMDKSTPCVVFMGGGYSKPIEHTIDAFYDLFAQAAEAHQHSA